MKKIAYIFIFLLVLISCTDNERARNFGGEETIKLESGMRLINATWKQNDLWFLVEPMPEGYAPATKVFHESSSYGVWQGTVIFVESR